MSKKFCHVKIIPPRVYWLIFLTVFYFVSCKKDFVETNYQTSNEVRFSVTDQEKELTSLTKEIGDVLKVIYQYPEVLREVDAAIYSGYEKDECISVKNLLQTESSPLYHFAEFNKRNITPGVFYKYFSEEVATGSYPLINKYYGSYLSKSNASNTSVNSFKVGSPATAAAGPDNGLLKYEIWVVNGVKVYFPYSENFAATYDPRSPTINNTGNPGGPVVSTVSADRDADSGPGQEPYWVTDQYGVQHLTSRQVTVDDAYAETKATHIVNVMDGDRDPPPPTIPPVTTGPIYQVWISWVRSDKMYDRLISFSGNGGGPDLRFARDYAFLDADGQVKTTGPVVGGSLSRKDVRKKRWVHMYQLWNTNWKPEQLSNHLGIWEEDNKGSITFTGSVSGKFKILGVETTVSTGFSYTKQSQDPILGNVDWDRDSYFRTAALNKGRGFQDGWPIYNADLHVDYTMPYQVIP